MSKTVPFTSNILLVNSTRKNLNMPFLNVAVSENLIVAPMSKDVIIAKGSLNSEGTLTLVPLPTKSAKSLT